ncbi:MAG: serine/threonine-protein phosphatase [Oscillospiraceae bacterium]|nr:serine/threonine-protein phosphatase [Oscillospiraceae bacterium]
MIYASSRKGKHHNVNEDTIVIGTEILSDSSGSFEIPDNGFICIADGVGGNEGGDKASHFVAQELSEWNGRSKDSIKEFLTQINNNLIEASVTDVNARDRATTLTGFFVNGSAFKVIHIGNTRAFIRQGKYLKQITSDHTTYNWLVRSGQTEAAESANRSEITNCFGGIDAALLSKLYIADCQEFSLALLTSDGVHDYLSLDELEEIISDVSSYSDKCETIIQKAIDAGSEDDISVVIVCPMEG